MLQALHRLAILSALVWLLAGPTAGPTAEQPDWKFDTIRLKSGWQWKGLIVQETPTEVWFERISRNPGRPTVKIFTRLRRSEIDRIYPLSADDRKVLASRVEQLDPTGKIEDQRMEQLDLTSPAYFSGGKRQGQSYSSEHFYLISNAHEQIIRRAAVRLEQLYAAFTLYLPPVRRPLKPNASSTIIILVKSTADYQDLLKSQGRDLFNLAFFDASRNEVVCASELEQLGQELERIRTLHDKKLEEIRALEAEVNRLPAGEVQRRAREQIAEARKEIGRVSSKNEERFQAATRQLFQTLYHEAFHAYLSNFVYPPGSYRVPAWLNEGLAQVFETAILEAGELRVGHADPVRLEGVRNAILKREVVPLLDLLRSQSSQFVIAHGGDRKLADRHYLTSWALAHYLTFERRLLGTRDLDNYLLALTRDADPVSSFVQFVGQPLPQFEKDFHNYMLRLQPDGTLAPAK